MYDGQSRLELLRRRKVLAKRLHQVADVPAVHVAMAALAMVIVFSYPYVEMQTGPARRNAMTVPHSGAHDGTR
jgi:hypothetical protein